MNHLGNSDPSQAAPTYIIPPLGSQTSSSGQTRAREGNLEEGRGCVLPKPSHSDALPPERPRLLLLPSSTTDWEPRVQMLEPLGAIFIQTTQELPLKAQRGHK